MSTLRTLARNRQLRLASSVLLTVACDSNPIRDPVSRVVLAVEWDTVWAAPGAGDSILLQPYHLAAINGQVIANDADGYIVSLGLQDGLMRWKAGRKGSGPEEFRQPHWLGTTPTQEVMVLDRGARRLVMWFSDGRYSRYVSLLAARGDPNAVCALTDGTFLVFLDGDSVARITADGRVSRRGVQPWNVSDIHGTVNQTVLDRDPVNGTCAVAMLVGDRFTSFRTAGGFGTPSPFVEAFPIPQWSRASDGSDSLSHNHGAANDIEVRNDTLWVLFSGTTELRLQLLDAYLLSGGEYLFTLLLPGRASFFALTESGFVFRMTHEDGRPVLISMRPRWLPAPVRLDEVAPR